MSPADKNNGDTELPTRPKPAVATSEVEKKTQEELIWDIRTVDKLRRAWPADADSPASLSGIECLMVVVRNLFSYLPVHQRRALPGETETNSLLDNVGFDDIGENPPSAVAKEWLISRLLPDLDVDAVQAQLRDNSPNLSFRTLATSPAMTTTLWKRPEFMLFLEWRCGVPANIPPADWTVFKPEGDHLAAAGLVRLGADDHEDLGKAVSDHFGSFLDAAGDRRLVKLSNRPTFVRILLTNAATGAPRNMGNLRSFLMRRNGIEYKDGAHRYYNVVEEVRYNLVVAVRLRSEDPAAASSPDCRDAVRVWSRAGTNLPPYEIQGQRVPAIDDATWHVGEPGAEYMLFYVYADGTKSASNLPEIRPPFPAAVDVELRRIMSSRVQNVPQDYLLEHEQKRS